MNVNRLNTNGAMFTILCKRRSFGVSLKENFWIWPSHLPFRNTVLHQPLSNLVECQDFTKKLQNLPLLWAQSQILYELNLFLKHYLQGLLHWRTPSRLLRKSTSGWVCSKQYSQLLVKKYQHYWLRYLYTVVNSKYLNIISSNVFHWDEIYIT